MNIYEKSHKLSDSEFKRLIGVQRDTFEEMLQILRKAYAYIHQSRGRKSKLLIEEMLFVTLKYLRQYPTMKELAFEYNVAESTIHRTITWVEDILIRSRKFTLPSRKALVQSNSSIDYVLVDVTESPIERPKKNKRTTTQARKNITPSKHKSSCIRKRKKFLVLRKEKGIYTTFVCSKKAWDMPFIGKSRYLQIVAIKEYKRSMPRVAFPKSHRRNIL